MESPRFKACCCGCDLKSGSLVISWLNFICSSGILCNLLMEAAIIGEHSNIWHIISLNILPFVICLFGSTMSIILMIGVYKENVNFLKVWIVIISVATCIGLICCFLMAFNIIRDAPDKIIIVGCILVFAGIFYSLYVTYTIYVVHNFTRQLCKENEKDTPISTIKTISILK